MPPQRDYPKAKRIIGDADPNARGDEFVYGEDGKPFFIAGPHDGPSRCRQIIDNLTARCGARGFHYLLAVPRSVALSLAGGNSPAKDDEDELD